MSLLTTILLVMYGTGFFVCLPTAYRWCNSGYDYHGQNLTYNGTAAMGFALVWFIFLPSYFIFVHRPKTSTS